MPVLAIRKLKPDKVLKEDRTIIIIGKRNTGKTTCLKSICYHMRKRVDFVLAFSPTRSTRQMLAEIIPQSYIHSTFEPEVLERCVAVQTHAESRSRKVLILIDDFAYDSALFKSDVMRELFLNGRHLRMGVIITAQYLMTVPPIFRSNTDVVMTFRENVLSVRQNLHKSFFGIFPTMQEFATAMDEVTKEYGVLVLNNASQSTSVHDTKDPPILWYKAKLDLPPFYMGRRVYWQLHRRFANRRNTGKKPFKDPVVKITADGVEKRDSNGYELK